MFGRATIEYKLGMARKGALFRPPQIFPESTRPVPLLRVACRPIGQALICRKILPAALRCLSEI